MNAPDEGLTTHGKNILESQTMTLPSTLESVQAIEEAVEQMALRAGFDADEACDLAMVSREAAINACKHGNGFVAETSVVASLQRTAEALIVRVADQGKGMDPEGIPDPLQPENILRDSGRGIFLMRAIMDEVHFRQLEPGTEVTLIKHRTLEAST